MVLAELRAHYDQLVDIGGKYDSVPTGCIEALDAVGHSCATLLPVKPELGRQLFEQVLDPLSVIRHLEIVDVAWHVEVVTWSAHTIILGEFGESCADLGWLLRSAQLSVRGRTGFFFVIWG